MKNFSWVFGVLISFCSKYSSCKSCIIWGIFVLNPFKDNNRGRETSKEVLYSLRDRWWNPGPRGDGEIWSDLWCISKVVAVCWMVAPPKERCPCQIPGTWEFTTFIKESLQMSLIEGFWDRRATLIIWVGPKSNYNSPWKRYIETWHTGKALALIWPTPSAFWLTPVSPHAAPCGLVAPSLGISGITNYLYNGTCLLICWPWDI